MNFLLTTSNFRFSDSYFEMFKVAQTNLSIVNKEEKMIRGVMKLSTSLPLSRMVTMTTSSDLIAEKRGAFFCRPTTYKI
jgi:hypothetical protein